MSEETTSLEAKATENIAVNVDETEVSSPSVSPTPSSVSTDDREYVDNATESNPHVEELRSELEQLNTGSGDAEESNFRLELIADESAIDKTNDDRLTNTNSSQTDDLNQEIVQLKSQLAEKTRELDEERRVFNEYSVQIQEKLTVIEEINRELDQKSAQIATIELQLTESQQRCEQMAVEMEAVNERQAGEYSSQLETMRNELDSVRQDRERLECENVKMKFDMESREEESRRLVDELEAGRNQFASMRDDYERRLGELGAQIDGLSRDCGDYSAQIDELKQLNSRLVYDKTQLEELLSPKDEEIESLKTRLNEFGKQLNELNNYFETCEEKFNVISEQNNELTSANQTLKTQLEEEKSVGAALLLQIDAQNEAMEDMSKELDALKNLFAQTRDEYEMREKEYGSRLDELSINLSQSKQAYQELEARNIEYLKAIDEQKDANQNEIATAESLKTEIERLCQELTDEKQSSSDRLEALKTEISSLSTQLEEAREASRTFEAEKTALIADLDQERSISGEYHRRMESINNQLQEQYTEVANQREIIRQSEQDKELILAELESQKKHCGDYLVQIEEMNRELAQKSSERGNYLAQIEEMSRELDQKSAQIATIELQLTESQQRCDQLTLELKEANERRTGEYSSQLETMRNELDSLRQDRERLECENVKMKFDMESREEESRRLVDELEAGRNQLASIREDYERRLGELGAQIEGLSRDCGDYSAQIDELKQLNSQLGVDIESNIEKMKTLESEKLVLDEETRHLKDSHEKQIQEFKSNFETLIEEKTQIENKLSSILEEKTSENDYNQTRFEELNGQFEKALNTIRELETELEQLKENASLADQLDQCRTQLAEMVERNKDLVSENEIFLAQLQEAKSRVDESMHAGDLRTEMDRLAAENLSLKTELDAYKSKFDELKTFIAGCEQQFYRTQEQNKTLVCENERLKSEITKEQQTMTVYLEQIDGLTQSLNSKSTELDESKRQLAQKQSIVDSQSTQLRDAEAKLAHLEDYNSQLEAQTDKIRKEYEVEMKSVNQNYGEENYKLKKEINELRKTSEAQIQHLQEEMLKKLEDFDTQKSSLRADYESRVEKLEEELKREKEAARDMRSEIDVLTNEMLNERKQSQDVKRELGIENKLLRSQLETATATQTRLLEDKNRLLAELDACRRDHAELQAKFCEATGEKEKLLKEIVELSKKQAERSDSSKQIEFQMKLEEKLDQLQSRLDKTKRMSGQFKSHGLSSSNMNESFINRLDNQIETKLQNKLNAIIDEKHKYLVEIQNLKMENAKLTKEKRSFKEEHAKNKQLEATLKQNLKEIARLNDEIKSLKDTNEFLSDQVNNLNKQIYELSNKENDSKPTSSSRSGGKKLNDSRIESSPKTKDPNRSIHLADFDNNTSSLKQKLTVDEDEKACTPNNLSRITTPETPSSSLRQRNCAQQ